MPCPFMVFVLSSPHWQLLMASHCPFLAPCHTTLRTTRNIGWEFGWGGYCCPSSSSPISLPSTMFRFLVSVPLFLCFNSPCIASALHSYRVRSQSILPPLLNFPRSCFPS